MDKKILAFDTSSNNCIVTVAAGKNILAVQTDQRPSMQAESLMILVEAALKQSGLIYKDLDYLAAIVGPGSFTGVRVGLAAANAISYAGKIKTLPLTNFEYYYYQLKRQTVDCQYYLALCEAYRQQVYVQIFDNQGAIAPAKVLDYDKIGDFLTPYQDGMIACGGSGLLSVYGRLLTQPNLLLLPRFAKIRPNHLARLAWQKSASSIGEKLLPLYIRAADAVPKQQ